MVGKPVNALVSLHLMGHFNSISHSRKLKLWTFLQALQNVCGPIALGMSVIGCLVFGVYLVALQRPFEHGEGSDPRGQHRRDRSVPSGQAADYQ